MVMIMVMIMMMIMVIREALEGKEVRCLFILNLDPAMWKINPVGQSYV